MVRMVLACLFFTISATVAFAAKPNVIIILADDVGYGDLSCYGATKIKTPNLDTIARQGMRFTDAHSPAAVCTPTRYTLLTGQYSFRHMPGARILSGVAPLSIPANRPTIAQLFKGEGYATGVVGKWHLGLGDPAPDFNAEIKPGAREVGFDYSFLIPATGDRTPCVYVENGRVVNHDPKDPIQVNYTAKVGKDPTGKENPELLTNQKPSHGHDNTIVNGISRIGYMTGGTKARWKDEDMADTITGKAVSFIETNKQKPFFLYFATHDAHVPRCPHPRFRGTSGHGLRGDAIQELDWCVGELLNTLEKNKLSQDTLIIFTSDNGGVMDDGYVDGTGTDTSGHKLNGVLRAVKGSPYEGGHRVPMVARWPGKIPTASTSSALIYHGDFYATMAAILEVKLKDGAAPDSINQLPTYLKEKPDAPCRTQLINQAGNPNHHAFRHNEWKLVLPLPRAGKPQLFNLKDDLSETKDLAATMPEKVKELQTAYETMKGKN